MCTVLLPPDDNPIAVNKYIISNQIPWILALWPSGLCHGVVWWLVISISEEHTAFTLKVGQSMFLTKVDKHPSDYTVT